MDSPDLDRHAERAFLEFLAALEDDEESSFRDLRDAHLGLGEQLRRLATDWLRASRALSRQPEADAPGRSRPGQSARGP